MCTRIIVSFNATQKLQSELKVQIKIASQVTPSPRAKATMETLERTKADLADGYDSVIHSLEKLHRISQERNGNITDNYGSFGNPVENEIDVEVKRSIERSGSTKKGNLSDW